MHYINTSPPLPAPPPAPPQCHVFLLAISTTTISITTISTTAIGFS